MGGNIYWSKDNLLVDTPLRKMISPPAASYQLSLIVQGGVELLESSSIYGEMLLRTSVFS